VLKIHRTVLPAERVGKRRAFFQARKLCAISAAGFYKQNQQISRPFAISVMNNPMTPQVPLVFTKTRLPLQS
jgi:hypothetical protein